ncbi:MAG: rhomboid family intramembrane serine protease [Candidatus Ranarchaeia archaeon]|jgi:membrane associated rhomboid family serine protease
MVVFERYNIQGRSWARNLLLGINVLFFLGELIAFNEFVTLFAMWPSDILTGQYLWTLVTSTFLHGDFWHIFFNMWGLYIFGNDVEQYFGSWVFLGLYLFWGVFANIFYVFATLYLTPWALNIPTLGASGALFGVMASYAILYPKRQLTVFLFLFPIRMGARTFVLFYALIQFVYLFLAPFSAMTGGGIAYAAHIGGFIIGWISTQIVKRRRYKPPKRSFIEYSWDGEDGRLEWDNTP